MKHIDKDNVIIGYKGFDKNLRCRGKQYEVGKEYHEDKVLICNRGLHFVTDPSDLFTYYPPSKDNRFCIIEAWGDVDSNNNDSKHCASDLFILKELPIAELTEEIATYRVTHLKNESSNIGDHSLVSNAKSFSSASSTDSHSIAYNIGVYSSSSNTGSCSLASNAGGSSSSSNTGHKSSASNSGYKSSASNTGLYSLASNTGGRSLACNTGDHSSASNTGDFSSSVNTGYGSSVISMGKDSIAAVFGKNCYAKGALGCWLVLTERDDDWHILGMKCVKVDGKTIKADTWYWLKDGEVKEYEE